MGHLEASCLKVTYLQSESPSQEYCYLNANGATDTFRVSTRKPLYFIYYVIFRHSDQPISLVMLSYMVKIHPSAGERDSEPTSQSG